MIVKACITCENRPGLLSLRYPPTHLIVGARNCVRRREKAWFRGYSLVPSALYTYFGGELIAPCRAGVVYTVTETTHTASRKECAKKRGGGGGGEVLFSRSHST